MVWYNAGYLYKKAITQDHTKVSTANQSNFPVLISRTDANLKTVGNGGHVQSSSGFDIIFTDSTETTKLDHEIEKYVASTGEIVMHVRIPTLSNSTDTVIYMYYGNSSISTSQENVNGTWDSNYKAVWHLKEATGTDASDSTSNGNTATQSNSPTQGSGQIGGGLSFNGTNQQLSVASPTTGLNFANSDSWTLSFWAKPTTTNTAIQAPIGHIQMSGNFPGYDILSNTTSGSANSAGRFLVQLINNASTNTAQVNTTSATNLNDGNWHLYHVTYNGGNAASGITFYEDGASKGLSVASNTLSATTAVSQPFTIGARNANNFYQGQLDEVRVSNAVRSAGWIATEYNNQSSPSTFYSVGSEVIQTVSLSATFAGTGTLSATTSLSTALSTTLAGQGTLAPTLSANLALPSVTLAGQGTLSASYDLSTSLSTTLAGQGSLIPTLSASMDLGSATLSGQGSLSGSISLSTALATSLDGQGTLSAVLDAAMSLSAQFDGTSSLTANPTLSTDLATTMAGAGTLDASFDLSTSLSAEFDGIGALTAALSTDNSVNLAVTMDGAGAITGTLSLATELSAEFDGISTLSAIPSLSTALSTSLDGVGTLSATPELATSLSANLAGQGTLSATLSTDNTANLTVTMSGAGTLSASPEFSLSLASVSLDGNSVLTANVALSTSLAVAMAGQSALSGAIDLSVALGTTLAGLSTLSASLSVPVMLSVVFAGHSALFANLIGPPLNLVPNATFYVRTGKATFYARKGNATFFVRGE